MAAGETPQPVGRVGILGATAEGMGIATGLLAANIPVTVYDVAREPLDKATASVRSACQDAFMGGELTADQRDRRVALLAGTVNLHHLKDCDVIIDAMCADMGTRQHLLRRLNEVARPGAIWMTHAANVDIDHVASLARSPDNVLGFHLSNGANPLQGWELVPGRATSARALATASALVGKFGTPPEGIAVRYNQ
jgi:3-hydroxyacyl-CoA dehydrogenase